LTTVKHQRKPPSVFWHLRHLRGISQNPETFKTDKERRSQTQGPETLDHHHLETFQDRFKSLCNNHETKSQHCPNAQRRNRIALAPHGNGLRSQTSVTTSILGSPCRERQFRRSKAQQVTALTIKALELYVCALIPHICMSQYCHEESASSTRSHPLLRFSIGTHHKISFVLRNIDHFPEFCRPSLSRDKNSNSAISL
jgi:hypothetical protein